MKLWFAYIGVFVLGFACFLVMLLSSPNPESLILGEWKEMAWEYEMVDKVAKDDMAELSHELKDHSGKDLVIHKAETWTFLPNGKLKLTHDDDEKTVNWRIKGRGHILQIKYDNDTVEHYNLSELRSNKMVLNFEVDLQARGIAKLTFKKS